MTIVPASRSPRASPETSLRRSGMRRLRAWLVTSSRGPRVTVRPHDEGPPWLGSTPRASGCKPPVLETWKQVCPGVRSTVRGQKLPRWSAERRTSRVMGREAPRKRLRAYVTGPRTGASQAPKAPFGAPPPRMVRGGTTQTSEDKCLARTMKLARSVGWAKARNAPCPRERSMRAGQRRGLRCAQPTLRLLEASLARGNKCKTERLALKLMIALMKRSYTTILHLTRRCKIKSRWPAAALAASQDRFPTTTGRRP